MSPTPSSPDPATTGNAAAPSAWRTTMRSIALDALPPLLIFYLLNALGVPDVLAYTAGSIVPLARLVADKLRGRPFNVVSGLIAVFLLVSVALALVTADARTVIARGGVIFLAITLAALVSIPTRTPLMLALSRYFAVRARPESAPRFDELFRQPHTLRAMRRVTAVWALAFALGGVACVVCAYTLPITLAATATSLIEPIISLALAGATGRYLRRSIAPLRTAPTATTAPIPHVISQVDPS